MACRECREAVAAALINEARRIGSGEVRPTTAADVEGSFARIALALVPDSDLLDALATPDPCPPGGET